MLHWSHPCQVSAADVHPHPRQIHMISFRQFDDNPLFVVPVDDNGNVHRDYFYCRICCKWLSISTSTGNINKHIYRKHPELVTRVEPFDPQKIAAAKRLILLNCLPFSICDDPNFRMLCPGLERHSLSNYASELSDFIIDQIKNYIKNAVSVVLAIDEWSSQNNQPYLGIVAHCLFTNTYESFTIDQLVLRNKHNPAEIIAHTIANVIQEYDIAETYKGFISDTTVKMPAANQILNQTIGSNWYPCYCHIFDLLINKILDDANPLLKSMFLIQKKIGNTHAFHNYLILSNAKYSSIPSFSKTRWFSIYFTMRNFIELKEYITDFILQENIQIDEDSSFEPEIFQIVSEIIEVIATARTCIKELEAEEFGTVSLVLPSLRLFKKAVENLPNERWSEVKEQFFANLEGYSNAYFQGEQLTRLLVATRLNPIFTNELTSDEISLTDQYIRSTIQNAPAINSQPAIPVERYGLSLFSSQSNDEIDQVTKYAAVALSLRECSVSLEEFWFNHIADWPDLAEFALETLLPPASSASCERQFSLANRIDTKRRARLADSKVRE